MRLHGLFAVLILASVGAAQNPPAPGNVSLPLEEYNRLVELSGAPKKPSNAPPYFSIVKSALLNLHVEGEVVTGKVVLEGEVFAKGERRVPLVTGMIVLDAQQAGKDLALEKNGFTHSALLGPGEFTITLDVAIPLGIEPGRASLHLPVPPAGTARMALSVPGDQTLINLTPGLITNTGSSDGRTAIDATLVPGQTADVWWAARLSTQNPAPAARETRFLSDVKTLITVSEADMTVAALAGITVVQGEPAEFQMQTPPGWELTGASGPTLLASEVRPEGILLRVNAPGSRSHQFLISLTRSGVASKTEIPLPGFAGAQRETGEVLVEGEGALEMTASEKGGLRRMDFREASPYLRSLARAPLHAAFRFQKRPAETPSVALEWVRFPEKSVLAAIAQDAVVTTLVTSEGRSLTEVKLTMKNQSQPFLRVALPAGASIVSCEVAGEKVKPVTGPDGSRVPLLRAGLHTTGSYAVSFVFLHAGAPLTKRGDAELALPKMDAPIGSLQWEVFLPERYKVSDWGGDAVPASLMPGVVLAGGVLAGKDEGAARPLSAGAIGGRVTDPSGAVVSGARVSVVHLQTGETLQATTDSNGRWMVADTVGGPIQITAVMRGFRNAVRRVSYNADQGASIDLVLELGSVNETVMVTSSAETVKLKQEESQQAQRAARQNAASADTTASVNVTDLQRRVAGVLPIAVSVPRTGNAYRFVRPLVVDEETRLTFAYRTR